MLQSQNSREVQLESTLEKLVGISESLLHTETQAVNHQEIADAFKDISGARFVAFNLYDTTGTSYTTVAVSGLSRYMEKISSLLGFELMGKTWFHDTARHEKIRDQVLTRFESLAVLSGDVIPLFIIKRIQQLFSLGEVFLMRVMLGERMAGDFTFVMPLGVSFTASKATEIFSKQITLLLAQRQAEQNLLEQRSLLKHALEHQRILSNIAIGLNSLVDFDQRINDCLRIIGEHTNASRAYIFENNPDGNHTSNTYEWCNTGVSTEINNLQNVAFSSIPFVDRGLREEGMLYIYDISELDEKSQASLETQNIRSFLVIALYVKGSFFGFIGFDECGRHRYWDDSEIEMLRTMSGIISHACERRLMERNIEEERDKARMASQAKSEFLANMSHEIRTPMNAILGFSEALYHRLKKPENKKMVESVLAGGKLLLSLINDILDLSKIEAGKLELFVQPVHFPAILQETHMLFSEKAEKKGLQFYFDISPEMPQMLNMDETRVKQIIFNLISNAIKFTHHGYIRLSAHYAHKPSEQGGLFIVVEDTGIGIPEDLADHIFEDFNQLNPENSRKYEGTGLGLSICKRLVEKMNGKIEVRSTLGKGSVFNITLPGITISDHLQVFETAGGAPGRIAFEQSHVLVVDDVLTDIDMLESILISLGLQTSHALSGRQAFEMLKVSKPDLILLNTRMPEMNGYEFLQQVKNDETLQHIPVIAYSATVPGYTTNPLSRLFSGHIQKPVRRHVLIAELIKHLPHHLADNLHADDPSGNGYPPLSSEEAPYNINEINEVIKSAFLPQWKKIKNQLVLFKIERFAGELESFANSHHFDYLKGYANRLLHEANILDLESLRQTIALFPYICKEVDRLCTNSK